MIMKFKKSILIPLVLAVIGIFMSVASFIMIQVASKLNNGNTGPTPLAIFELVGFVLLLAALSSKKPMFTRVICIVSLASLVFASFVTAIVWSVQFQQYNVSWDTVTFLTLSMLAMVSTILFFIYYLIGRKDMLKKLSLVLNFFSLGFYGVYAILVIISSFVGFYKTRTFYGLELAFLLINVCVFLGLLLSLQNNLEREQK